MEVRNCPRCDKMFVFIGRKICPDCREQDERDFDRVREYLRRHPGANLDVIHEETEVEREKILEFIREGRLEISQDSLSAVAKCEICGSPVSQGRICDGCAQSFQSPLKKEKDSGGKARKGSRMYVTDMWEKKGRK